MNILLIAALAGQIAPTTPHNQPEIPKLVAAADALAAESVAPAPPSPIDQIKAARASFCIVTAVRTGNRGSGVMLKGDHAGAWIVTCAHVTGPTGSRVTVQFAGQRQVYRGYVRRADRRADASCVWLAKKPAGVPGVYIARHMLKPGERAYAVGFGSNGQLVAHVGRRVVQSAMDNGAWFEMSGHARQGDSGGPVIAVRESGPQVVGTLWGTDSRCIVATRLSVYRRLFKMRIYDNEKTDRVPVAPGVGGQPGQWPGAQPYAGGSYPGAGSWYQPGNC